MRGDELREARRRLGLTQAQLAEAFGVTQGRISQVESSDELIPPTWGLALEALAARLGLRIEG